MATNDVLRPTEAEEAVIGGLLISPDDIWEVMTILDPADFNDGRLAEVYRAMVAIAQRGDSIDVITLHAELSRRGTADNVGGMAALAAWSTRTPTSLHVLHHARIVVDAAIRRRLLAASQKVAKLAISGETGTEAAAQAEALVGGISEARTVSETVRLSDALRVMVDRVEAVQGGSTTGVPWGFRGLDRLTAGLHEGELVLIAARPGMGKTAFATQVAGNLGSAGIPVLIFSLEMPQHQLAQRMMAQFGGVPIARLRAGTLRQEDWNTIIDVANTLADWPVYINDKAGMDIMEIRAVARRYVRHGVRVIFVDYVQLVKARIGRRWSNRYEEVSAVARALKDLAHELGVTVVGLTQLNRAVEQRADKRPSLGDLRESGELEQAADVVITIYRDDVYQPGMAPTGDAEFSIVKHRQGPLGVVMMKYDAATTAFVTAE